MKGRKALFVANDFDIVIYRFRKEILQAFVANDVQVALVCPSSEKAVKFCQQNDIKLYPLTIDRRGKNPFKDLFLLLKYFKIIKKEKPDYIFSYTIKPNLYVGLISLLFGKKFFPNVTGLGSVFANKGFMQKLVTLMYRLSFKSAAKVFFQNEQNEKLFIDSKIIIKEKSIPLPGSGVNLEENKYIEYPKSSEEIRFIFLGRIMKEKGVYELLEAFKILETKYDNIKLDIYGFCEESNVDFLSKVEDLDSVKYHGFVDDIKSVMTQSHALILPSYHEGLSNVLLEAAAMGRPVIASDIPGCRETFDDGVTGLYCNANDVVSLFKSLEQFISMPYADKIQMGKAARQKIEKEFNREIVVDKYLQQLK